MSRVLILFAHPALEKSRVHNRMLFHLRQLSGVTLHDPYETYPDFDIDVAREQQLLLEHDIVIWQHPFYWYSSPAIIKQWMDLVLEHGWAYGSGGTKLEGKFILNTITCGGPREAYSSQGRNRFSIRELLAPFEQTAYLCKMTYLPPFVVHSTHRLTPEAMESHARQYHQLLQLLTSNEWKDKAWQQSEYMNDLLPSMLTNSMLKNG